MKTYIIREMSRFFFFTNAGVFDGSFVSPATSWGPDSSISQTSNTTLRPEGPAWSPLTSNHDGKNTLKLSVWQNLTHLLSCSLWADVGSEATSPRFHQSERYLNEMHVSEISPPLSEPLYPRTWGRGAAHKALKKGGKNEKRFDTIICCWSLQ